ncbi:hypothetical protein NBRC10512_002088 [Rhodotorula toruloides]|uniref:Phosphatidate cytidylyltransferase n=2 Tax=Rhodotorula toruloides TaxID=5286 RepID=A0A061B701_RHOTO|nr:phosphatidate cytidylyltransferase [Rhodotorula toruloides NP11]EMS21658.1 phosphatidate cytidylyltransferase [Rhodotorula toruloides NP11]CDR45684.1 RHTO0S11e03312g1_1 [Rhodotorula toruloides]
MARGKSASVTRPDVASKTRFDALAFDAGESSGDEELPPPATLSPPVPTTPSKKALARQRAKLRKQGSSNNLNSEAATDSDASFAPSVSAIPPVPALPSKVQIQQTANGVKEQVQEKAEEVKEATVKAAKPVVQVVAPAVEREEPKAASSLSRLAQPPSAPESTTDGDSLAGYDEDEDDESDEDEDETSAASAQTSPKPATPRAVSPTPAAPAEGDKPKEAYTGADHDPKKKIQAIITRTVWGFVLAGGAIGLVLMGHVYVIALIFVIQAMVFKELTNLFDVGYSGAHVTEEGKMTRTPEKEAKRRGRKEQRERWSRQMAWYFFAVTNYYLYGESLIYYFKHVLTLQASFLPTAYSFSQHHRLISFGLYTIGFVSFVATLNRSSLRRQFGLFGWIHMSLLLIVVSSHFIVNNILEGMIWFWVPVALVIINDIAAYVFGMAFGRHQLIKLSPKKTVEGFVGAFFFTMLFAYVWATIFMRYNYMICPAQDLSTNVFSRVQCKPNPCFEWHELPLPSALTDLLAPITRHHITSIPWAPFQLHSVVLAAFASLVAPFGGFFASGFKRAFGIKDFGDTIPGHGGLTDRMDCQFINGIFTFVYYSAFVRESYITPTSVMATIATHLTTEQQVELLGELSRFLMQKGVKATKPW